MIRSLIIFSCTFLCLLNGNSQEIEVNLTDDSKNKNRDLFAYVQLKAFQGNSVSMYNLGIMMELGIGTMSNIKRASEWYLKSAENGYVEAQLKVAKMYEAGMGLPENKEKSYFWYTQASRQNSFEALAKVGAAYRDGEIYSQDFALAENILTYGKSLGSLECGYELAILYKVLSDGNFLEGECYELLKELAAKNYEPSLIKLADSHFEKGDTGTALKYFSKASKLSNNAYAQKKLVKIYSDLGGHDHIMKALELHQILAHKHHEPSMLYLASCFEKGDLMHHSHEEAFFWYHKAATLKDSKVGWFKSGTYYESGIAVSANILSAANAFRRAADLGNEEAAYRLSKLIEKENSIRQRHGSYEEWLKKSADLGHKMACLEYAMLFPENERKLDSIFYNYLTKAVPVNEAHFQLGLIYQKSGLYKEAVLQFSSASTNLHKDAPLSLLHLLKKSPNLNRNNSLIYEKSLEWLENSASRGNSEAQFELGKIFLEKQEDKGLFWLKQAAQNKYLEAMKILSKYENGKWKSGDSSALVRALYWYLAAAEMGDGPSQERVAFAYLNGEGVIKNPIKAYVWFRIAQHNHMNLDEKLWLDALKHVREENLEEIELQIDQKLANMKIDNSLQ